ncbi:uncharacterized protein HD556DRAFT_1310427 [Suillus plorans]|uniref:Probable protein-export membrane protein SecG n=1 Tax=Suillus plorans TaxID=116603 RepID=A0A9P7DFD9_9AGAM|nr:uncharacterized protein HD556DRAFT_1310427 [Suillus plorans]KAG1790641.1 hypothetical protein HD556DRAFT_1310427 [Suillus plorans]
MPLVSSNPSWWPLINAEIIGSYFVVAACVMAIYDWGLAFGQEVELVWRQRWSMMTVLYLVARYGGIGFVVINILLDVPTIPTTDGGCRIMFDAINWTSDVVDLILGAIMITRLHAMYQRSRKMLIFLVVIFLAIRIALVVVIVLQIKQVSGEESALSGTYQCIFNYSGDSQFLGSMTWILGTAWEVLALCLAVWIAVKHFRELRRDSTRSIIVDCFTVLMQTHASYFASFLAIACFHIGSFSPTISADIESLGAQTYFGLAQIFDMAQLTVLGPRLILSVREYNAKLVADSDIATAMSSIAFQERVHVETSNTV